MIKDLLCRIANKDNEAFEQLYDLTYRKIYVMIYRIVKDRAITEDLIHDTYIKVWNKANTYKVIYNDERWLLRIARNLAYDHLRRLKCSNNLIKNTPNDQFIQHINITEIGDAMILSCLTDEEKLAIKYKIAGYDQKQIAVNTGWNIDRIKYLNRSAKKKIEHYMIDNK